MEARVELVRLGDRTRTSCIHERTCVGAANALTNWASQTDVWFVTCCPVSIWRPSICHGTRRVNNYWNNDTINKLFVIESTVPRLSCTRSTRVITFRWSSVEFETGSAPSLPLHLHFLSNYLPSLQLSASLLPILSPSNSLACTL